MHVVGRSTTRQLAIVAAAIGCGLLSCAAGQGQSDFLALQSLGEPVTGAARKPASKLERDYWVTNMVAYHGFSLQEVQAATELTASEIKQTVAELGLQPFGGTKAAQSQGLVVRPYPGGRHPRIGFLDGAVRPQRETKFSVFLPWDSTSYVVADIPEAIWSQLGLTYLAHTHIDTVWDAQGQALEPLEWHRTPDGELWNQRTLPNGIVFGTQVVPASDHVAMRMWLHNGTPEMLSDLRVQNCIMLKAAKGFDAQIAVNKRFRGPYVACHDDSQQRWIITAWQPIHRAWGNPPCPCLHADPRFPDTAPGETHQLVGWLSFYEGDDIDAELTRLQGLGWETAWLKKPLPTPSAP